MQQKLGVRLQNENPCIKLVEVAPEDFSCGLGLECGRKSCTEYDPEKELWMKEIQESFK